MRRTLYLIFCLAFAQTVHAASLRALLDRAWANNPQAQTLQAKRAESAAGAKVMQYLLGAHQVLIGIEENKPQAITGMRAACANTCFEVVAVPVVYPSGGAKQLTKILTGKEAPSGGPPTDSGVQVFNVATAYSVARRIAWRSVDLAHRHRHRQCRPATQL